MTTEDRGLIFMARLRLAAAGFRVSEMTDEQVLDLMHTVTEAMNDLAAKALAFTEALLAAYADAGSRIVAGEGRKDDRRRLHLRPGR